jgi:hypothetical protein
VVGPRAAFACVLSLAVAATALWLLFAEPGTTRPPLAPQTTPRSGVGAAAGELRNTSPTGTSAPDGAPASGPFPIL